MAKCPGCGMSAALNVVVDDEGREWHRDCLEKHERAGAEPQPRPVAGGGAEFSRLEHEVEDLRKRLDDLKSSSRGRTSRVR